MSTITIDNVQNYFRIASKEQSEKIFKKPQKYPFKYIVSILDPPARRRDPNLIVGNREPKGMYAFYKATKAGPLLIKVHDNERKEYEKYGKSWCPTKNDIIQIIGYGKSIKNPCLFHCTSGVSLSASAAIIAMASMFGRGKEKEIVEKAYQIRGDIVPNLLMLRYADELLSTKEYTSRLEKIAAWKISPEYNLPESEKRKIKMPKKIDLRGIPQKIRVPGKKIRLS